MRYVTFYENLSAYDLNSMFVPSLVFVPYSLPIFSISDTIIVFSSNYDSEDENPPLPTHRSLVESNEHEYTLAP
jgi:hypothetical protein